MSVSIADFNVNKFFFLTRRRLHREDQEASRDSVPQLWLDLG